MPSLEINPRYRDFLQRHRLLSADDFLALPGPIVSGHPDRHVARVALGSGPDAMGGFLKREHRVLWRERLGNACAGFGFVSHSRREAQLLRHLRRAGVGCPEWIAAGEDANGRAFLLVRELSGATELRQWLRSSEATPIHRRRLARRLGEVLAHVHDAGFDQPNLYSKHVLLGADRSTFHFLDWQRSRWRHFLGWPRRWRNLAALHATLADDLAGPRDRRTFLHAYLRATLPGATPRFFRARALRCIVDHAARLMRYRHIRELRRPPLVGGTQQLIWLDGEALCVTPEMREIFTVRRPSWLTEPTDGVEWSTVAVPGSPRAMLVRRGNWTLANLWTWLCGWPARSPELRQAALLFRLQRYGIRGPRLLAFGQRRVSPGRLQSFLLAEMPRKTTGFVEWLMRPPSGKAELSERRCLIRQAATLLKNLHEASCYLRRREALPLQVHWRPGKAAEVVLGQVEGIRLRRHAGPRRQLADLARLRAALPRCNRSDALRFLLAYLGQRRLTAPARAWWKSSARPPRPQEAAA